MLVEILSLFLSSSPVGTAYPNHLSPENHRELDRITLDQISRLAEWANDHFGIVVAGDLINDRRGKLLEQYIFY
eukprot:scaffold352799_cov56-Attheya_sp.AAC.1